MKRFLYYAPVVFIGAVFLFAGLDKAFHYQGFVSALASYAIVPEALAPFLALPLICVEILAGVGAFVPVWRRPALFTCAVLLAVFTIALAFNYVYMPGSICGCWFTLTLGETTPMHIIQNFVWLTLAVIAWWETCQRERNARGPRIAAAGARLARP